MRTILTKIRALFHRIFFWHEGGKQSSEFIPNAGHDHALVLHVAEPSKIPRWRQLRYVSHVLSIKERRALIAATLVFGLGIVGIAWAISTERMIRVPSNGGRMIEAVVGAPKAINPIYAAKNDPDQDLVSLVYAGLFRRTGGTGVVPDIVERFEWSDNGKRLRLELRKDVRFHDGTPLTSDDVLFTIHVAKNPSWRSTYATALRDVNGERIDDYTLDIVLKEPDIFILDALTIGILPAHIWLDISPGNALLADANIRPIGAGPFKIHSFRKDTRGVVLAYTLERYEGYHGIQPFLSQIEFRYFPSKEQAEDALRGGRVDALAFVESGSISRLTSNERLTYATIELPQETIAFFNLNDELLKHSKVRQALALAVDRELVVDAQAGISTPVYGPYPFDDVTPTASSSEERLDAARALLTEAGWVQVMNSEVRVRKDTAQGSPSSTMNATASSTELVLTISVPQVADLISVAQVLARRWSLLGAKVNVDVADPDQLAQRATRARDTQILVWNVRLNPSQDLYPVWWSGNAKGNGLNLSNLSDRNVDDAIEALRNATTTEALKALRKTLSNAILSRDPAVFLTRPAYGYVYSSDIRGVSNRLELGTPSDRFLDIPNWYVKKRWAWK